MSRLEAAICSTRTWSLLVRRGVLPSALAGETVEGAGVEIGSGGGAIAAQLLRAHPGLRLTATDIDPAMVERAAARLEPFGERARVVHADATALPFDDASFDVAFSFLMLHHVPAWRDALADLARVLRPGGRLFAYDVRDSRLNRFAHAITRSEGVTLVDEAAVERAVAGMALEDVRAAAGRGRQVYRVHARRTRPG